MKRVLKIFWIFYSAAGALWLTFSIISLGGMQLKTKKHVVSGRVEETHKASWDGFHEVYALVKTDDGKGNVWAKIYRPGIENGDQIAVEISENAVGGSRYIHTVIKR